MLDGATSKPLERAAWQTTADGRKPEHITGTSMREILRLEHHGADIFVGTGPQYPWGGLFGGQILAQALRAASDTVDESVPPHSLRAYFIRPGDHTEPVRYEVDRLRNGRSFTTRRVVARQAVGAILNLEASFTRGEEGIDHARVPMSTTWRPDASVAVSWIDRRVEAPQLGSGEVNVWLRFTEAVGHDPCAVAFLSDDVPSDSIRCLLTPPGGDITAFDRHWFAVSLDHTLWFHAPFESDRWHLHSFRCERYVGGRALTAGRIYSEDGRHVTSVAQEMLVRPQRNVSTTSDRSVDRETTGADQNEQ
ncbi:MAG TPA: acyl-CoA thioesterase domain-containing protein [Acidimicrobiales bacterium]|nr:acyl-CoA thioesterase domain-containing protein [Acidimicrobiales bacterium]